MGGMILRNLMIVYLGMYILTVLGASIYSYFKSKHMNLLGFVLSLLCLTVVLLSLIYYAQSYHALQMVGFALAFTVISSIFFYNGVRDTSSKFTIVFTFSMIRLVIHLQLLFFLYYFR